MDLANNFTTDSILQPIDSEIFDKTNKKSLKLVNSFVKRYCQQHGTFTITNEFFTPHNSEYKQSSKYLPLQHRRASKYYRTSS